MPEVRARALGRRAGELRRAGRNADAVRLLREAVRLAPAHAGLVGNLGNALLALGDRAAALVVLEHACALEPGSATLAYNLGRGHYDEGRLADARAAFERALALGGLEVPARVNLGRIDEIEGRLDAAAAQWSRAARLAPGLARPHYLLARVGRLADRAPLEALVAAPGTGANDRLEAHFGLGHVLDRAGQWSRAFAHFQEGNRLKRALLPRFDPAGHEAEVERLVHAFDARAFGALEPAHASEAPLFVVGLPRSGTTLIESILGAHPEVEPRGERLEIDVLARRFRARGFPEDPHAVPATERLQAAQTYLDALDPAGSARRLVDKMPGNTVHLGVIAALFPNARVVHARRDPLDVALSLYFQLFEGESLSYSYDLEHVARVIRAHERLMRHWRATLPLAFLEVDYEELVRDPEGTARALVRFAGLEWSEACLERRSAHVRTASAWRVRAPVDRASVGRWRPYAKELAPVRELLGDPADPPRDP